MNQVQMQPCSPARLFAHPCARGSPARMWLAHALAREIFHALAREVFPRQWRRVRMGEKRVREKPIWGH